LPSLYARKPVSLKLEPALAVDLHAFCEAHFNAPHNEVICRALRRFIDAELAADAVAKGRFLEARQRLLPPTAIKIRLVGGPDEDHG
jgi:hypothetical protein